MIVRFFDTESSDLAGNFGRLHSYSAVDLPLVPCKGPGACDCRSQCTTFRRDRRPWKGGPADDSRLAVAIRRHLEEADVIVGWNSILHDLPLINSRLLAVGERPVRMGEKYGRSHLDLMYYARGQSMKIGSSRLETVAKFFSSPHQKTPLTPKVWAEAGEGSREAFDLIVEHNEYDALVTRDMWPHLAQQVKKFQFPLSEVWTFVDQIPSRRGA